MYSNVENSYQKMNRYIVSWLAYNNDFGMGGAIDHNGPNGTIHSQFMNEYDKHVWLIPWQEGDDNEKMREGHLKTYLNKCPVKEKIECRHVLVHDPININEVREKSETVIQELRDREVEIFISPGTPAMQTAWYFIQLSHPIKLFQTRKRIFRKQEKIEREYISIELERVSASVVVKQDLIERPSIENEYVLDTPTLKPIYEKASKIAQTDNVTTLIVGESGTGKEHLAKYIHEQSSRKHAPFITVNCSAMGDQLLESRLFGYKKGAFTGADKDAKGLFQEANGGTIFLDEIGDISAYMQQSLLRVLQEKEVTPIGQAKPIRFDARVITATNRDLVGMCKEEKFRWDLYYRLAVADLELPSLAQRGKVELKLMTEYFLKKKKRVFDRTKVLKMSKEAESIFYSYPFPGNIRELENLIERFHVFCDETIQVSDLPKRVFEPDEKFSWKWQDVEKLHIQKALEYFKWNKQRVANEIGVAYNTLQDRINKYNLNP